MGSQRMHSGRGLLASYAVQEMEVSVQGRLGGHDRMEQFLFLQYNRLGGGKKTRCT